MHIIVHVGNYTEGNKAKRQDAGLGRRDEKEEKDKEEGGKRKKGTKQDEMKDEMKRRKEKLIEAKSVTEVFIHDVAH